jgi:hypothetical protein
MSKFDFSKVWHVLAVIAFALTSIFILNMIFNIEYTNEGSLDVITGALVETFILTVFFEYLNARQQRRTEDHLQNHLRAVEKLIKDNK